jgi:hypothetical protein
MPLPEAMSGIDKASQEAAGYDDVPFGAGLSVVATAFVTQAASISAMQISMMDRASAIARLAI